MTKICNKDQNNDQWHWQANNVHLCDRVVTNVHQLGWFYFYQLWNLEFIQLNWQFHMSHHFNTNETDNGQT
jgi:hypothetical protein